MRWISKDPPIYVWYMDEWYNERNGKVYFADIVSDMWIHRIEPYEDDDEIDFPNKTMVREKSGWRKVKRN